MPTDRSRSNDQQRESTRSRTPERSAPEQNAPTHPILRLQQQVGNRQVARMLAQRQREEEQAAIQLEREEPEVGLEGGPISSGLTPRIQAKRGGGSPIPDATRAKMESGFGTSFENVRLHTDNESASISRSLGAKAATTGSDIFFGKGASPSDSNLLAHELTHVVQQSTMRTSGPMTVSQDGDAHEVEANKMSSAVNRSALQRKVDEE